jgi:hypothetical protein
MHGTLLRELIFGAVLGNLVICINILRIVVRIYQKYYHRITEVYKKLAIVWEDYGYKKYPNITKYERHVLLKQEIEEYDGL